MSSGRPLAGQVALITGAGRERDDLAAMQTYAAAISSQFDTAVRVGICPGIIETGMTTANRRLVADLEGVSEDEARELILAEVPLGRGADADEVAQLVTFLCSPAAAYIFGALVPIDGGMLP